MTYLDKVKASKGILDAIEALGNDEYIVVSYGTDYNGQPREFKIRCSIYERTGASYSIYRNDGWSLDGMNIDSLTNTQAKAYTYDMMSQRTNYNFPLYEMELVPEEKGELV
jgi:hypothetical protein